MDNVEINRTIMVMTRATAMTLITSIDMTTIVMMMTRAKAMLLIKNNDVYGNVTTSFSSLLMRTMLSGDLNEKIQHIANSSQK